MQTDSIIDAAVSGTVSTAVSLTFTYLLGIHSKKIV